MSGPDQSISRDSTKTPAKKDLSFSKLLQMDKVSFHVFSPNNALHNSIIIQPAGIRDSSLIQIGVIGNVKDAFVGDLNRDGYPEIYFVTETDSGLHNLYGYGSNKNLNLSPVLIPEIKDDKRWGAGYRGHDEYKISGDYLLRSFPVYSATDPMSKPSGGIRKLNYHLVPGINGWILKIVEPKSKTK